MKQHITKFEKSTPRQLAYVLLGVGAIGLALTVGDTHLGFGTGVAGSWIMLVGFIGATIFLALAGGAPVPSGITETEVEDRVKVVMSDELQAGFQSKVEDAVNLVSKNAEELLKQLSSYNETSIKSLNEQNEAYLAQMRTQGESVISEITQKNAEFVTSVKNRIDEVEATLQMLNIRDVADEIAAFSKSVDFSATNAALDEVTSNSVTLNARLDELSTLSASQTDKIERTIAEITENLEVLKSELSQNTAQLNQSMSGVDQQLSQTLRQFESFNQPV